MTIFNLIQKQNQRNNYFFQNGKASNCVTNDFTFSLNKRVRMVVDLLTIRLKMFLTPLHFKYRNNTLFSKICHIYFLKSIRKTITVNYVEEQDGFLYLFLNLLYFHIQAIQLLIKDLNMNYEL